MRESGLLRTIPDLELRDPTINIALEEAIARTVSSGSAPPTLRFWRDKYSAVLGRSQAARKELNMKRCREVELSVVRRPSGGGTVLHHPNNLNYSLYLPEADSGTVREEAIRLSHPVATALQEIGLAPSVQPNGLFIGTKKIGGTAQSRRWGLLHHGTLLLKNSDIMNSMRDFLRAQGENYEDINPKLPSKPSDVSNLTDLTGGRVKPQELLEDLRAEFAERLDLTPVSGRISEEEWKHASELAERKYSSNEWTFRFSNDGRERQRSQKRETMINR